MAFVRLSVFNGYEHLVPPPKSEKMVNFVTVCHGSHERLPSPSTVTYLLNGPRPTSRYTGRQVHNSLGISSPPPCKKISTFFNNFFINMYGPKCHEMPEKFVRCLLNNHIMMIIRTLFDLFYECSFSYRKLFLTLGVFSFFDGDRTCTSRVKILKVLSRKVIVCTKRIFLCCVIPC